MGNVPEHCAETSGTFFFPILSAYRMPVFFLFGVILFYTLYIMTKGSTGRKTDYSYRALHGQPSNTQTDFSYRPPHGRPKNQPPQVQTDFSYRNKIPISSNRMEPSATQKQGKLTAVEFAEITGLTGRQLDDEYQQYKDAYEEYDGKEENALNPNPNRLVGPRTQHKRYRTRARARKRTRSRSRSQKRTRSRARTRANRLR